MLERYTCAEARRREAGMTEMEKNQALHEIETMLMRLKAATRYVEQVRSDIEAVTPNNALPLRDDYWSEESVTARQIADNLNALWLLIDSITVCIRTTCHILHLRVGSVYARVGRVKGD